MKILVAAHKPYDNTKYPSCYYPIKVGNFNNDVEYKFLNDNTHDNISNKNSTYCELTALYWGWKNLSCDISGLCHYRRYFVKTINSFSSNLKQILDEKDILKILKKKKIIIPKLEYRNVNQPKLYRDKDKSKQDYYLVKTEEILNDLSKDYLPAWFRFAYNYKVAWGNMFILKKEYYDKYCSWLFPILFKLEELCIKDNKVTPRIFGFVSEILLCTWVYTNFSKKEIKQLPVINTEDKEKHHFIKVILRRIGLYNIIKYFSYKYRYKKSNY